MVDRLVVQLTFGIALFSLSSVSVAGTIFTASLTGEQVVPPVVTTATGSAELELSDDQSQLSYEIEVFGLDIGKIKTEDNDDDDIVGVHIHVGPVGENGPVVFGSFRPQHDQDDRFITINGGSGFIRFRGVWDDADVANGASPLADQLTNLMNGGLYVQVHTEAHPGGELRGQIVPEPSAVPLAVMAAIGIFHLAGRRGRS